jgi:hypothetical protein
MKIDQRPILSGRRRPSLPCRASLPASGERDAFIEDFANRHRCRIGEFRAAVVLLPVYGEKSRQGMRGSANAEWFQATSERA